MPLLVYAFVFRLASMALMGTASFLTSLLTFIKTRSVALSSFTYDAIEMEVDLGLHL